MAQPAASVRASHGSAARCSQTTSNRPSRGAPRSVASVTTNDSMRPASRRARRGACTRAAATRLVAHVGEGEHPRRGPAAHRGLRSKLPAPALDEGPEAAVVPDGGIQPAPEATSGSTPVRTASSNRRDVHRTAPRPAGSSAAAAARAAKAAADAAVVHRRTAASVPLLEEAPGGEQPLCLGKRHVGAAGAAHMLRHWRARPAAPGVRPPGLACRDPRPRRTGRSARPGRRRR